MPIMAPGTLCPLPPSLSASCYLPFHLLAYLQTARTVHTLTSADGQGMEETQLEQKVPQGSKGYWARKTLRAANKNPLPYNLSAHACVVDGKLKLVSPLSSPWTPWRQRLQLQLQLDHEQSVLTVGTASLAGRDAPVDDDADADADCCALIAP